jgi:hypothetical protein
VPEALFPQFFRRRRQLLFGHLGFLGTRLELLGQALNVRLCRGVLELNALLLLLEAGRLLFLLLELLLGGLQLLGALVQKSLSLFQQCLALFRGLLGGSQLGEQRFTCLLLLLKRQLHHLAQIVTSAGTVGGQIQLHLLLQTLLPHLFYVRCREHQQADQQEIADDN